MSIYPLRWNKCLRAGESWTWQWVFPSPSLFTNSPTNIRRRHFLFPERLQRALKVAVAQTGIGKQVSVEVLLGALSH
jgi:hypothetical protein